MQALGEVTLWAETFKSVDDKVTTGQDLGGKDWNLGGSFMLFRGAPMQDDWVKPYTDKVGTEVKLP